MRKSVVRPLVAGALCVSALMTGALADCIGGAETTTAVNLRSGAGTGYSVITTLAEGTAVIVEENDGSGWYKVSYDGKSGYMSADYMSFSESMELSADGWVDGTSVRMRSEATTDSGIVRVTSDNESVEIIGVEGEWYKVVAGGETGYIRSDYIVLSEPEPAQSGTTDGNLGSQIVEYAKQFLGVPYVWAGNYPSTGFDCSGFACYVFKNFGYSLYRTTYDQYDYNGSYVAKEDLQPGDLVFFSSSSYAVGHVGIYIGNGQFIHASSGAGYVTISGLDESYYTRNYVGAKRVA